MNFGQALEALKNGQRVYRKSWSGQHIFIVPGSTFKVSRAPLLGIYPEGAVIDYYQHIDVAYADGQVAVWSANQVDILEEDWAIYGG